jgi:hypothetical protein
MKISRSSIILITALLVLGLAACVRTIPGVEAPPTVPVTGEPAALASPGTPGATDDVLNQIYLFATQTAIAANGGQPAQPPAQGTPVPGAVQPQPGQPQPGQPQPGQPQQPAPTSPAAPQAA